MKKLSLIISLCLTFAVLSSCARKDLSDEARESWRRAEAEQNNIPAEACRSIYDCYRKCGGDNDCVTACIEAGADRPEGLELFTAIINCTADNCASVSTSEEELNNCFLNYCKKEFEDCNMVINQLDPTDTDTADTDTADTDTGDTFDPSACTLDESILDCSSSEYCFAFKGEGVISADINSDTYTDNAAATLFGFDSYNKDLDSAVSLFISTTFNDYQAVELLVNGDPDNFGFTTGVTAYIPISYIDNMKNNGSDRLSVAPVSKVYDFLVSHEYVKQCLIAASRMSYVDEFGGQEMPVGATQVCYTETDSFGVGETFRLAMRAELVTDVQELVDMFEHIDYPEDLCSCHELGSNSEVDCSVLFDNPCDPNPCSGIMNATGECTPLGKESYACRCNDSTYWEGSLCADLPVCNTSSGTPCKDFTTGLTWSSKTETMSWQDANDYCENAVLGGFTDWRLPTIDELRTLIKNCGRTIAGGECGVTDPDCLSESCYDEEKCRCEDDPTGGHSGFGETGWFWSASVQSDTVAWTVDFQSGEVNGSEKEDDINIYARCVRYE